MKPKTLIPLSDYVLRDPDKVRYGDSITVTATRLGNIIDYAKFLKQPLKLEMFIPCDDEGNILEEPKLEVVKTYIDREPDEEYVPDIEEYQKAQEKILFKGFIEDNFDFNTNSKIYKCVKYGFYVGGNDIIEDLVYFNLELC